MADTKHLAPQLLEDYRNLLMTKERLKGFSYEAIAETFGLTTKKVKTIIQDTGSEMIRQVMLRVISEPGHPSKPRYTLEQFNDNPRALLDDYVDHTIGVIESQFGLKPTDVYPFNKKEG